MTAVDLVNGNALAIPLADKSVHMTCCSPPYWGLRDYGLGDSGIGLEPALEKYVDNMVAVGREVWRVMRDDGTWWLNLGDTYWGGKGKSSQAWSTKNQDRETFQKSQHQICSTGETRPQDGKHEIIKAKDMIGIPWRVALALQADGWYLRSDIIWAKPNPMPESVTDRPTKSHEYVFLLTKWPRYFYDAEAIKERSQSDHPSGNGYKRDERLSYLDKNGAKGSDDPWQMQLTRNKRSVWNVTPRPWPGRHFATWPEKLVEPMIKAGSSEAGCCPRCGGPWKRVVEKRFVAQQDIKDFDRLPRSQSGLDESSGWAGTLRGTNSVATKGWLPSCECLAGAIPCTVLDPFAGSGTTGVVARRLGRHFVGLDLSFDYLRDQARVRLGLDVLKAWNNGDGRRVVDGPRPEGAML